MKLIAFAAAAAYWATVAAQQSTPTAMGVEAPSASPVSMKPVVQGCFSSAGELVYQANATAERYMSIGKCGTEICMQLFNKKVGATTRGSKCYCGDKYPAKAALVDDKFCNAPCTGYGQDACGGGAYWTVYNTGLDVFDVDSSDNSTAPKASSTDAAAGETVVVTQTNDVNGPKSSGPNTAGIAAGVIVAVVVVGAALGGFFFYMRRKRNQELQEEHRRNAAVSSFIHGGKPPSSSGGFSDARLDPVMAHRRMSDGSIADNQDYSRKILRVTNA